MGLYFLQGIAGTHPVAGHLGMVRRKVHQVSQEQTNQRDTARCQNRPLRSEKSRCSVDGRHHNNNLHIGSGISLWQIEKHLSALDDGHHHLARCAGFCRRLYQDFPQEERRPARQIQDCGPGEHRVDCGSHAIFQSRRCDTPKCRDREKRADYQRDTQERGCKIGVYAATTVGEETTMRGAHWAGSRIKPDVAIAVDVTYAQDYPGTNPEESGDVHLGKGPVICNSSMANAKVNALLKSCAESKKIPYQMESFIGRTGTDADKIHFAGDGFVTALLSLPLRYMHSPSEVCHFDDIENSIELLAEFLCTIDENTDLNPFS